MNEFGEVITLHGDVYSRTLVDAEGNKREPRHWFYTIPGTPATKKNSQRIIPVRMKGGKTKNVILPSKNYLAYEKSAVASLEPQTDQPIDFPISLTCVYYMPTRRQVDLANLIEASQDILVKAGILKDDCRDIVYELDGSRVMFDKEYPRVEITIWELPYATLWRTPAVFAVKPSVKRKSVRKKKGSFAKLEAEEGWNQNLPF